jgi:2,4-diaminopentanoate dehydrogenase
MAYRVVHCGTGYAGSTALRLILARPDLELVGQYVSTPAKAGKDSGELIGVEPTGVLATNDWAELVDLDADCLTYFADSVAREREAMEDLVPFLERGTNAVSISGWQLGHRATMPPDLLEVIDAACTAGGSSCFFTSIDPGWATSDLAIAALAPANRVDCIRVMELGWFANYTAEFASREYFGFGKEPGFQPELVTGGFIEEMWAPTLHRLADVLGVEIEEFKVLYETDSVDHDIETGFGTVKAGTAAVVRFELQALSRGRPFAILEHVDRLPRDAREVGKPWKQPYGPEHHAYRIEVDGDPSFTVEMNFGAGSGSFISMPAINAIPALCAAPPGLLGPLDLSRYWTPNVTARVGPWP